MTSLSLSAYKPVSGALADAAQLSNGMTAIETWANGSVDDLNFATGLIFNPAQIKQGGATSGQVLAWSGSAWAPSSISFASLAPGGATASSLLMYNGSAWVPTTGGATNGAQL